MRGFIKRAEDLPFFLSIELPLIFLILFSPLIHGGITAFPLIIIELVGLLAIFSYVTHLLISRESKIVKSPIWLLLIAIFIVCLQLLKVPGSFLAVVSPSTFKIYQDFFVLKPSQFTVSISPNLTVGMLLQVIVYFGLFWVVMNYCSDEARYRRLLGAIIIAGFFYSLVGILNKLHTPIQEFSTFTNRNHFAAYIQMIIAIAIGYSFGSLNKVKRFITLFFSSIMIVALFYSSSRTARICFLLSLPLYFIFLSFKRTKIEFKRSFLLLFIILLVLIPTVGIVPLMHKMDTLAKPLAAYYSRFIMMLDTLRIAKDFPLTGIGLGTYGEIAQKYKTLDLGFDFSYGFSHNEPVQLIAEIGVVGFICILIFLILYFKGIFLTWLKRGNPFIIFTILGCAIGLLLALIHSLFDFIFHTPAVSLLFFIIMGIAFRGVYIDSSKEDVSCGFLRLGAAPTIKRITAILSVFIFIGTGLLVINRYRADSIFNKIKDQKVKAKGVDAIVEYRKICRRIDESISLNPLDSTYYYKKANIFAQLAVNDKIAVDLINIDEFGDKNSLLSNSEKLYTQAILLNPTKADYHLQLGWVYRIKGDKQYSDDEFNKAILLDPTNNGLRRYVEKYRLD